VVTQDSTYTASGNEKTGIVAYAPGITVATSKNGVMHTTTSMAISKNMIRIANLNGDAGVLRIYSIDGKAVYSHVINKSDKSFALPLSAVRCGEGIYCIQLTGTNDTHMLTSFIAHK
jgi:hypothetical protein